MKFNIMAYSRLKPALCHLYHHALFKSPFLQEVTVLKEIPWRFSLPKFEHHLCSGNSGNVLYITLDTVIVRIPILHATDIATAQWKSIAFFLLTRDFPSIFCITIKMSMGSMQLNEPKGFISVGTSGNTKPHDTMTCFSYWRFPLSFLKQPSPQLSSEAMALPFEPSTSHSSIWMKYSVSTTFPTKQAVKTSDLLYTDGRELQNIISCSSDSSICLVQGNLKYHTIYLHCVDSYVEDNTWNT